MSSKQRKSSTTQQRILKQAFELISSKFILNLPKQQKSQKTRLAFHYQRAYYYFIDQLSKQLYPKQPTRPIDQKWFFSHLNQVLGNNIKKIDGDEILKIMSRNKPTCGAIILNKKQDKVLVIENNNKYGFPKGGKNQYETAEDCAAREVKEEVGLFIHELINRNDKVEFLGRDQIPITYYIIHKFDENQQLKIDKNQIDNAFWMNIEYLSKNISKFTQKSRIAWRQFSNRITISSSLNMEQFINLYRDKNQSLNNNQINSNVENPFNNFTLDRDKLFAVFSIVED